MPDEWWNDREKLAMTASFMAAQQTDDPAQALRNVLYMLEKPWKHDDDYNLAQVQNDLPDDLWQS
jgi:hypothetical protein